MSTRANIYIRESNDDREKEILYHHCDGYPEGVGRTLRSILHKLPKEGTMTLTKQSLAKFICDKRVCQKGVPLCTPSNLNLN
jgi:hypothetical protein